MPVAARLWSYTLTADLIELTRQAALNSCLQCGEKFGEDFLFKFSGQKVTEISAYAMCTHAVYITLIKHRVPPLSYATPPHQLGH